MEEKLSKEKLNEQPCFLELSGEEMSFLKDKKTQVTYQQGETIFKQGAFSPYVLFVVKGLVKIFLQTGYEKQINLRLAQAGDYLAFSSIFGENVYTYSAIALKETIICMIDKRALKDLLIKNPEFALKITSKNYQNENQLLEIIKTISYKQMRGKIASSLLYLSADAFKAETPFHFLSRQDLADFSSISTESAIKFLKEFEKENFIKLDGKDIEILNQTKLEDISLKG